MDIIAQNNHSNKPLSNKIINFVKLYRIGSILRECNAYKMRGIAVVEIFIVLISAIFQHKSIYQLLKEKHSGIKFEKDTVYRFMNSPHINWRKFTLLLGKEIIEKSIEPLTDEKRINVLIFDDSMFERNRSKCVELLAKVYDHAHDKYIKGFRMLTMLWSDGNTNIPLNFCLLSTNNKKCLLNSASDKIDHRTNGWKQRQLAITEAPSVLLQMLRDAKEAGIRAKHVLFDTWFCSPKSLINIKNLGFYAIAMTKKDEKNCFVYHGKKQSVLSIYRTEKKRPGKSRYLLSVKAYARKDDEEIPVRLVYVRNRNKRKEYLILVTTDMSLSEEDIIRLYGKRWNIEVFFKMCKSFLNLSKECRSISYDGITAHVAIVFSRYSLLAVENRNNIDQRTLGELFYIMVDELEDIRYMEALQMIMNLFVDQLKGLALFDEKRLDVILDKFLSDLPNMWNMCLKRCS